MELTDKRVIITGAARGIGAALARRIDAEKPRAMVLLDRDLAGLEALAVELGCAEVKVGLCDVADESALAPFVAAMEAQGGVDLFCANAGIFPAGGIEVPLDTWAQALQVNVMSHVHAARACLPGMLERGSGYLLHTVSAAGLLSQLGSAPYTVSKHAALAFAEWLSITYGGRGIGVTALCPQGVDTPMLADIGNVATVALDGVLSAGEVAETAVQTISEERFLALPHPQVADYFKRKAEDYERWLAGMRRLQEKLSPGA